MAFPLELTDLAAGVGRRRSRRINVGKVAVGDGAPVSVQSMTITKTADINGTLQQIAELAATGCDIAGGGARHRRRRRPARDRGQVDHPGGGRHPLPVEVRHGRHRGRLRRGPHQPRQHQEARQGEADRPGGAGPRHPHPGRGQRRLAQKELLAKHGGPTPEALVESALFEVGILEEVGFGDIKISVKHQNPASMIAAYRLLATRVDYPLHLGVTEAGTPRDGIVKSAVGIGALLAQGIGDTIGCRSPPCRSRRSRPATPSSAPRPAAQEARPTPARPPAAGRGRRVRPGQRRRGAHGRDRGPDAGGGHGLHRQRSSGEAREADVGARLRQGQGPDLPARPGDPHRARGRDRRRPDARGQAAGRGVPHVRGHAGRPEVIRS